MNLPLAITTFKLWELFQVEGNITLIEIFENRSGSRDGNAKIRFEPPPNRDFWTSGFYTLRLDDGLRRVVVKVEPQRRRFQIQSPIRRHVYYPETMTLYPSSLMFGFMYDPTTMMVMHEVKKTTPKDLIFKLDLLRRNLEIRFKCEIRDSESKTTPDGSNFPNSVKPLERESEYLFRVPFGELEKIHRVEMKSDQFAFMFSLKSAPRYFRKLTSICATHNNDGLKWGENDCWYRQTDIVHRSSDLENSSVSLRKPVPVIDIGIIYSLWVIFMG
jgi:RNA-dependent RNA polymerase